MGKRPQDTQQAAQDWIIGQESAWGATLSRACGRVWTPALPGVCTVAASCQLWYWAPLQEPSAGSASREAGWWGRCSCPHVRSPDVLCATSSTHQLAEGRPRHTDAISVAAGAALGTTKCGTGILGVAATRDRGTLVFLVLSLEGLAKKLWLVRPWGGGAAGESGWRVGGCDQVVRQHLVSNQGAQEPFRTRGEVRSPAQPQQPRHLLLEVRRGNHPRPLWC